MEWNSNNIIHQELMTSQVNLSGFSYQVIAIQYFLETQMLMAIITLVFAAFCSFFFSDTFGFSILFNISCQLDKLWIWLKFPFKSRANSLTIWWRQVCCWIKTSCQGQCCYCLPRVASKKTACFCGVRKSCKIEQKPIKKPLRDGNMHQEQLSCAGGKKKKKNTMVNLF